MHTFFQDDPASRQMLEERAHVLALQDTTADTEQGEELLTFRLGDGCYGVAATFVREVQPLENYTRLPSAPAFVVGLVNVRGRLLVALDIRPLLSMEPFPPQASSFLLIISAGGVEVGLLADGVMEIRRVAIELSPTPSTTAGHGVAWVRGVDQFRNVVLDPPLLLEDPRLVVKDDAE